MKRIFLGLIVLTSIGFAQISRAENPAVLPDKVPYFASLQLGLVSPGAFGDGTSTVFDFGARVGLIQAIANSENKILLSIGYEHYNTNDYFGYYYYNALTMQFSYWCSHGFYFGPNVGVVVESVNPNYAARPIHGDTNTTYLEIGVQTGYDYKINDQFSVGPQIRYERGLNIATLNTLKFLASGTVNF